MALRAYGRRGWKSSGKSIRYELEYRSHHVSRHGFQKAKDFGAKDFGENLFRLTAELTRRAFASANGWRFEKFELCRLFFDTHAQLSLFFAIHHPQGF